MRRSRFTEEQIVGIFKEQEAGARTDAVLQSRDYRAVVVLEGPKAIANERYLCRNMQAEILRKWCLAGKPLDRSVYLLIAPERRKPTS